MSRDSDISDLCKEVINIAPEYSYNPNNYDSTVCPFCGKFEYNTDSEMEDIKHDINCAYLIAKDLMTNLTPPS